jgi:hypothetical protein
MRSIFLLFESILTNDISEFLDKYCTSHSGIFPVRQWIIVSDNDPCLYIDNTPLEEIDLSFEDSGIPLLYSQMKNPVVWAVDISGRHNGTAEVMELATALLSTFMMYLMDDYTNHCWTYEEITMNTKIEGHKFFDYIGWYKKRCSHL